METEERSKRISEYRGKSVLVDKLDDFGKREDALNILREYKRIAAEAGDDDYRLYFEAEIIYYTDRNLPLQIDLIEKALAWSEQQKYPSDYFLIRQKGSYLSILGNEKAAIEWFNRALAIKPDDYISLNNMGVAVGRLGDAKAAIEWFNRALTIKPDNYVSLRNMGVALGILGNLKAADEFIDRALAISPEDHNSMRNKGVIRSRLGDAKAAIEWFDRALAIKPDDHVSLSEYANVAFSIKNYETATEKIRQATKLAPEELRDNFRLIMRLSGKNPDDEWNVLFPGEKKEHVELIDRLSDIRGFVGTIRAGLGDNGRAFLNQKDAAESNEKMFLHPESGLAADRSFLLVLRKWNSYTPAIPSDEDERSLGGGYFIYHNGRGCVIDPGYNFIENFHSAGCRIHDIDNIVITHAHNDHTIDFESICTLLHQYNQDARKAGRMMKKICLYLNNGAFKKFSGLLNLLDHYFETIRTLNVGNQYLITSGMNLHVLPAYHDEVVARNQSVGLLFTFSFGDSVKNIVFTGDTGLFPLTTDDEPKPDISGDELWKAYPTLAMESPNLLVVHMGSIKKEELEADPSQGIEKCLYPNHLGMIGTARMITKLKPHLALVSEFGEETRQFRRTLIERIEEDVVKKAFKEGPFPRVVPGDLTFMYDIANSKFLCCANYDWVDVGEIVCDYGDDKKENLYYFRKDALDKIGKSAYADSIKAFTKRRRDKKGMYFRTD